jgi:hypothetical protein
MRSLICLLLLSLSAAAAPTLRLHPENPRYFEWRGKPAVLIGSGEHYGAVLNLDFDFATYLATLERDGLNVTRTFTGAGYVEPEHAFNISKNTLAPKPGRFLAPWARSDQAGAWDGGNKWDLERWNEDYFTRFKAFVAEASKRGVVVEVTLFCPFYPDAADGKKSPMWPLSPWQAANNTNGLGEVAYDRVHTLDGHGGLLAVQERFVRRIVAELKDADNVYYELCNEPYFGGVTVAWQHHLAQVLADAQKDHPNPKLISQNIANKTATVEAPSPLVSIFNFHYAYPPVAVEENWGLHKPIGDNETGFRGQADEVYRNEAWDFMLAGGALFNHLDYSFAAGHEDGGFAYPPAQPGGGSAALRAQLGVLKKFLEGFDFLKLKPVPVRTEGGGDSLSVRALGEPGQAVAAYIHRSAAPGWEDAQKLHRGSFEQTFSLEFPAGDYQAEWIEPATGKILRSDRHAHPGGSMPLSTPVFHADLALRLRRL